MMINNHWILYYIEIPSKDDIYDVRLTKKHDLLSSPIETIMEFKNGEWLLRVPAFVNEYEVSAWRYR